MKFLLNTKLQAASQTAKCSANSLRWAVFPERLSNRFKQSQVQGGSEALCCFPLWTNKVGHSLNGVRSLSQKRLPGLAVQAWGLFSAHTTKCSLISCSSHCQNNKDMCLTGYKSHLREAPCPAGDAQLKPTQSHLCSQNTALSGQFLSHPSFAYGFLFCVCVCMCMCASACVCICVSGAFFFFNSGLFVRLFVF